MCLYYIILSKKLNLKNSRIKTSRVIYSIYQFFPFLFKILIRNIFKEQSYSKKKRKEKLSMNTQEIETQTLFERKKIKSRFKEDLDLLV